MTLVFLELCVFTDMNKLVKLVIFAVIFPLESTRRVNVIQAVNMYIYLTFCHDYRRRRELLKDDEAVWH